MTRVILRDTQFGEVYVADTDGYTGEVFAAAGPLHYSEVAAIFADAAPNWTEGLAADLNMITDRLAVRTLAEEVQA